MPEASAAAERRLSPQELESQLQLPRVVRGRDGPEPAGAAVAVWRAEVRVIEQVERFEAELEARLSAQREALRECGVELENFGPLTVLRPALPNGWLGSVGTLTQVRSNQLLMVCASPCA